MVNSTLISNLGGWGVVQCNPFTSISANVSSCTPTSLGNCGYAVFQQPQATTHDTASSMEI